MSFAVPSTPEPSTSSKQVNDKKEMKTPGHQKPKAVRKVEKKVQLKKLLENDNKEKEKDNTDKIEAPKNLCKMS